MVVLIIIMMMIIILIKLLLSSFKKPEVIKSFRTHISLHEQPYTGYEGVFVDSENVIVQKCTNPKYIILVSLPQTK